MYAFLNAVIQGWGRGGGDGGGGVSIDTDHITERSNANPNNIPLKGPLAKYTPVNDSL